MVTAWSGSGAVWIGKTRRRYVDAELTPLAWLVDDGPASQTRCRRQAVRIVCGEESGEILRIPASVTTHAVEGGEAPEASDGGLCPTGAAAMWLRGVFYGFAGPCNWREWASAGLVQAFFIPRRTPNARPVCPGIRNIPLTGTDVLPDERALARAASSSIQGEKHT